MKLLYILDNYIIYNVKNIYKYIPSDIYVKIYFNYLLIK